MAGGDHTLQRMSRAKYSSDLSPLCRFCDEEEETQEHIAWKCRCWSQHRTALTKMISEADWNAQPPFTRHCGLFAEDPRLLDLQKTLSHDILPQPVPRQPQESDEDDVWHEYTDSLGCRWVYAGTDGACQHQAHPLLARAGYGVFLRSGAPAQLLRQSARACTVSPTRRNVGLGPPRFRSRKTSPHIRRQPSRLRCLRSDPGRNTAAS